MEGYFVVSAFLLFFFALSGQTGGRRCPENWTYNNVTESCYVIVDEFVPWTSAEAVCRVLEAHMVEIENEEENQFVQDLVQQTSGVYNIWLGLNDFVKEGQWVWNSRRKPTFTRWAPGEPNNNQLFEGGEDCVQLYGSTGTWDDAWREQSYDAREKISPACEMSADTAEEIIGK